MVCLPTLCRPLGKFNQTTPSHTGIRSRARFDLFDLGLTKYACTGYRSPDNEKRTLIVMMFMF